MGENAEWQNPRFAHARTSSSPGPPRRAGGARPRWVTGAATAAPARPATVRRARARSKDPAAAGQPG